VCVRTANCEHVDKKPGISQERFGAELQQESVRRASQRSRSTICLLCLFVVVPSSAALPC
jgi:hypothetical protein